MFVEVVCVVLLVAGGGVGGGGGGTEYVETDPFIAHVIPQSPIK